MQSEFVVASPQQQQAIASFTVSASQRYMVLTGAAGTGKTLVALQVAINLIQSLEATADTDKGPVLLVTAEFLIKGSPLLRYLDAKTTKAKTKIFDTWPGIMKEYDVSESDREMQLVYLTEALAKRWEERKIVILLDEIFNHDRWLNSLADHADTIPQCVKLMLVVNPAFTSFLPTSLPESFLHINLATPYRSTIAITSLARFLAKCEGKVVPEGEFGSDVEGKKPIVYDVGKDEVKLRKALQTSQNLFGNDATLLYDGYLPYSIQKICKSKGKKKGGPWECYIAGEFFGWEVGVGDVHPYLHPLNNVSQFPDSFQTTSSHFVINRHFLAHPYNGDFQIFGVNVEG